MENIIFDILKTTFGFSTFRTPQEEIIRHTMSGKDALVIMPTGGGKSLCFQIPALASDGLTLVVSPLIALMNDQVMNLKQVGVSAAALHSNMTSQETMEVERKINNNEIKLLYMSPERINNDNTKRYLSNCNIKLIAIDEAHCVSIWGNDFRPDYVQLATLRNTFPSVPILALTATADETTQQDICTQLKLNDPKVFISSFERKNIVTYSHAGQKKLDKIAHILSDYREECGIIYCLSRKDTEKVSARLNSLGLNTDYYHAGMNAEDRYRVQRAFQNDQIKIICATIAFGMGIDKSNIRFVIHHNMPKNLEAYYQEIGRAGRDGNPAVAHLFSSWGDFLLLKRFIDDSDGNNDFKNVQNAKLERMWEYASTSDCRTNGVLAYFGEYKNVDCGHCDNCIKPPIKKNGTIEAQKILSAIWRSNQSVGIELLIDILRGSQRYEIRERGLDKIKTFGVGRDLPRNLWKNFIIQLINKGIVGVNYSNGSVLTWTPLSNAVLKNEKPILLAEFVPVEKSKPKIAKEIFSEDIDVSLFAKLKAWRLEKAKAKKMPAYIILSNKSLEEIAATKPADKVELLEVNGIGKAKIEMYGDELLEIIVDE
ncbi:MAG: DNA helicase RecQ [Saprospiraceae bacterium]